MKKIEDFLFNISGYKPRLKEGQFVVNESILSQADEAYGNKNYEICVAIWERYANLNNGISLVRLADCYWNGLGVNVDYKKSFDLLTKGTLLIGGSQNYFNLGVGYQLGGFTDKDLYKSYFFYLCSFHYALENEIELKNQSKQRMNDLFEELSEENKNLVNLLLRAVEKGFEPAGMSVATELYDKL